MTKQTVFKLILAFGLMLASTALAAERFSSLEERMTYQEFTETGLHKLSEEELARLNEWLRLRSLAEGEVVAAPAGEAEDDDGSRPPLSAEGPFETYIVGTFSGWSGPPTRLEMGDGSVWEIVDARTFHTAPVENPKVVIQQGLLGSWNLRVEGYNTRARVRRVR